MACHSAVIPLCICVSVCLSAFCVSVQTGDGEHCLCASVCLFVFLCVLYASLLSISISLVLPLAVLFLFVCFPGKLIRAKRMVVAANPTEYEYTEGSIPMEWDGKSGLLHHCYICYLSLSVDK